MAITFPPTYHLTPREEALLREREAAARRDAAAAEEKRLAEEAAAREALERAERRARAERRERIATRVMTGLVSAGLYNDPKNAASLAVQHAQALMEELDRAA